MLLQKQQTKDFRLTWQGEVCRIWFKIRSHSGSAAVWQLTTIYLESTYFTRRGKKVASEYDRNLQNVDYCGEDGQNPAVNSLFLIS